MYSSSSRARRMPFSIWNESSRSGSLIKPFQPTVVRGFSKYTRMIGSSVESTLAASALRRAAYSRAAATSWIEHGPTTTNNRGSRRSSMARTISRELNTVCAARIGQRQTRFTSSGVASRSLEATLTFCSWSWIFIAAPLHRCSDGPELGKELQFQSLGQIRHAASAAGAAFVADDALDRLDVGKSP